MSRSTCHRSLLELSELEKSGPHSIKQPFIECNGIEVLDGAAEPPKMVRRAFSSILPTALPPTRYLDVSSVEGHRGATVYTENKKKQTFFFPGKLGAGDKKEPSVARAAVLGKKQARKNDNFVSKVGEQALSRELIGELQDEDVAEFWLYLKEHYQEENFLAWQTMAAFLQDPLADISNAKDAIYDIYFGADSKWCVSVPTDVALELDRVFNNGDIASDFNCVADALRRAQASLQPFLLQALEGYRKIRHAVL